ncbi:uncharacterized protein LOC111374740 [Olea europaea var. sylvestris]|uniref:uncharacterized protein LOC111374740 n=1 Tax=Olea europaea var. sylvestris TaxID=158386 RepID=UPI000C1D723E|nr:uncharacterized protein LOC111374740 [Olea europaea var. sylvestris]
MNPSRNYINNYVIKANDRDVPITHLESSKRQKLHCRQIQPDSSCFYFSLPPYRSQWNMASELSTGKNKLLYSDLFKGQRNMASTPSAETLFGSKGNSSLSGLSSPFGSELDSTETSGSEDEDFFAELARQMAELMLQEDEYNSFSNCGSDESNLKNQATVGKQGRAACGRRVRGSESPQRKQFYQTKQRWNWENGHYYGSGMRAVFLGGSGSSNGSGGTGVFLPRGSSVSAGHNKRSDLHGNESSHIDREVQLIKDLLTTNKNENEEMQLPQEWTY